LWYEKYVFILTAYLIDERFNELVTDGGEYYNLKYS
jgi:hypothetical protein